MADGDDPRARPVLLDAEASVAPRLVQLSLEVREIDADVLSMASTRPVRRLAASTPTTEIVGAAMGPAEAAALLRAVADGLMAGQHVIGGTDG